jgi:hypothetical protein
MRARLDKVFGFMVTNCSTGLHFETGRDALPASGRKIEVVSDLTISATCTHRRAVKLSSGDAAEAPHLPPTDRCLDRGRVVVQESSI